MSFRIQGLPAEPFRPLYGLSDAALHERGVTRHIADRAVGFPDRIELRDASPGESLLLLNYLHQPAATPYRASHAIFVREGALRTYDALDEVPEVMQRRMISLRAFDAGDLMTGAELATGEAIAPAIRKLLADPAVAYLQAHYALRGCYAARVMRAA